MATLISLGTNCCFLNISNEQLLPFDRVFSSNFNDVIKLLDSQFEGFTEYSNLVQVYSPQFNAYLYSNKLYPSITFPHELNQVLTSSTDTAYLDFQRECQTRIDRLYDLLS